MCVVKKIFEGIAGPLPDKARFASCQGLRVGVSGNVLEWPPGLEGCRSGQRRGAISTTFGVYNFFKLMKLAIST